MNRIAAAIIAFQPPPGFKIVRPPAKHSGSSSPIWAYGVRVQSLLNPNEQAWYCLCGVCFTEGKGRKLISSEKSTTNLSNHLRQLHKIVSSRSSGMKQKKVDEIDAKTKRAKMLTTMAPERYHGLTIAISFVRLMMPFSFILDTHFRSTYLSDMPPLVQRMTPDILKRYVLELYLTTKSFTITLLADAKACAGGLRTFHLNIDLWTSKLSGMKYVGIRLYFVTRNFNYSSKLLAVKPFNPSTALRESERVSDILHVWTKDVLAEFNLSTSDLMSATTDSGADIKRLGGSLLGCKWDWCIPHLLNCALVEAFGTSVDPAKSKNAACRNVLMRAKRTIEYVNKSDPAKICLDEVQREHGASSLHLMSDVPQRWKSTANLLNRLLFLWNDVRMMFSRMARPFAIDADHALLVQLYSLMLPIIDILTCAQGGSVPEGPKIVALLAIARQKVLNLTAPLEIIDPAAPDASRHTFVDHDDLHPMAQDTRRQLLEAIDERFFKTYGNFQKRSGMLDVCCFLYPPLRSLPYIRFLLPVGTTPENVLTIEEKIRRDTEKEIRTLALVVVKVPKAAEGVRGVPPAAANRRAASAHTALDFLSLLGPVVQVPANGPVVMTADMIVDKEIREYKERIVSFESLPLEEALRYWRDNVNVFPTLSIVARAVFGFAVSAAGIERDFSVGGNCITRKRERLDEAIVEMLLYLNINGNDIPSVDVVPTLSNTVKLKTQLPARFKTAQFKAVRALTFTENASSDDEPDSD